jgi:hypothetical protein
MVGRWLRITETDAAKGGDGFWYRILSYTSATVITLEKPYQGTSISTGAAAYQISQCSLMPEQYQDLPMYWALGLYFNLPDPVKAKEYKDLYREGYSEMKIDYSVENVSCVIDDGDDNYQNNPNLFLTL